MTNQASASRNQIHLARRFFHLSAGILVGIIYQIFLTHQQVVTLIGIGACLLYLFEQIRINYPELSKFFGIFINAIIRAEEHLKESAALPYAMSVLLTILTFPKSIAVMSILTLAIADPMSAIVGIKFGKHKISARKSWEGSIAFGVSCFFVVLFVVSYLFANPLWKSFLVAFYVSVLAMFLEMIPIRLDDNLTIPLYTAVLGLVFTSYFDLNI
jgi:dolichol kinase